jgi:hypothetical protein
MSQCQDLNVQDREIVKSVSMEFSFTLENVNEDILALLVWGAKNSIASAATQTYISSLIRYCAGDIHVVPNGFNLTTVVAEGLSRFACDCHRQRSTISTPISASIKFLRRCNLHATV